MDILKPAREEIASLEKTVADAMVRLKDLRAFVEAGTRLYGSASVPASNLKQTDSWPLPQLSEVRAKQIQGASAKSSAIPTGTQSKASQIIARVEWALSDGRHMPSKELAGILKDHGIDLGADPIGSLSAYLSKSGHFVSERAKGGWALKSQSHKEEPPPDVTASAGA